MAITLRPNTCNFNVSINTPIRAGLKLGVGVLSLFVLVASVAAVEPPLKIGFGIGLTGPLSGNGKASRNANLGGGGQCPGWPHRP
jgi:hypothetical protein